MAIVYPCLAFVHIQGRVQRGQRVLLPDLQPPQDVRFSDAPGFQCLKNLCPLRLDQELFWRGVPERLSPYPHILDQAFKGEPETNTLAYFAFSSVTTKKVL
jgi:hypothetical protein